MPDKITYFAVVDSETAAEQPYGLVRRLEFDGNGFTDETLRRDFSWTFTPAIVEWKHGDLSYELVEVSHAQASKIIEYFREKWGPYGQPLDS
jgi:hypothetical protein